MKRPTIVLLSVVAPFVEGSVKERITATRLGYGDYVAYIADPGKIKFWVVHGLSDQGFQVPYSTTFEVMVNVAPGA